MESSRIFVRGLPPKFSDEEFKKHFAKFPVTDVKFFPHRRIGYVGYKTPEDAAKAVKYFNKSFIRMTRIYAEIARPIADENLHKSRRQQRDEKQGPTNDDYVPPPKDNSLKRKRADEQAENDPKLKEFLEVMQPRSKAKIWQNEDAELASGANLAEVVEKVDVPEGESDDEYQVIEQKSKLSSRGIKSPIPEPPPLVDAIVEDTEDIPMTDETANDAPQAAEADQGPVSDADWLRSKTKRLLDLEEEGRSQPAVPRPVSPPALQPEVDAPSPMEVDDPEPEKAEEDHVELSELTEEDKIAQTSRLFLRNLSYGVTEEDIRQHFAKLGPLVEVHVPVSKATGSGKGFAFVQYGEPEHAVEAFMQNDGTIFQGRLLHIISAKAKKDTTLDEFAISKLPLKKQKEIKRKADAASSTFNWNSLYLNTDAVMSTVASRLGISKSELLDPTSSDSAVKQAHAETHIIQETKAFFAQHGVDLEAFKRSAKGDTAILVKNIPHSVRPDEVQKLFEEHGTVKQFLMPPAGMTAIVEFENSTQTKTAFSSLAYRRMKSSILFLEKAPKNLFKEGFTAPSTTTSTATTLQNSVATKPSATELLQEEPELDSSNTATLYVKNLNFSTTTQRLSEVFSPLNGFRSARVKTKVDPKRGVLSLGFGFVEFNDTEAASAAARAMNGYRLDDHQLQIKSSHKGADAAEERRKEDSAKNAAGTKIIVKNLPFEASKKDLRALFAPYGQLRSVRVPKKFDSSSRGFGFAEFTAKREAANAMDALRNTHLLGRRLNLAFAEAETDDPEKELEKMQQKVGAQANKVALQRLTGGGRKRFNVAGNDEVDED
ncbi:RNA-binding domain-containing protein [Amniculicola lignicola CBS 123094]|uniref:Multiple RNA-binding domain-containing protein 1 n=1 Tax=Amniculicola lignicola CBS 123094 TaxID=1392246 RepID=A0A6A5WXU8_9PLEO|nr:RNA-binding domain-containing protein [Amniculicola lignicola CBS 123094]